MSPKLRESNKTVLSVFEAEEFEAGVAEQDGHACVAGEGVAAHDVADFFVVFVDGFAALGMEHSEFAARFEQAGQLGHGMLLVEKVGKHAVADDPVECRNGHGVSLHQLRQDGHQVARPPLQWNRLGGGRHEPGGGEQHHP